MYEYMNGWTDSHMDGWWQIIMMFTISTFSQQFCLEVAYNKEIVQFTIIVM